MGVVLSGCRDTVTGACKNVSQGQKERLYLYLIDVLERLFLGPSAIGLKGLMHCTQPGLEASVVMIISGGGRCTGLPFHIAGVFQPQASSALALGDRAIWAS